MEQIHTNILGLAAGFFTSTSLLPQIIKIVKTKRIRDIFLYTYLVLAIGISFWVVYGILIGGMPLIVTNSVTLGLCLLVITMKNVYGKNDSLLWRYWYRTKDFRYILYKNGKEELYKHPEDSFEHNNLADDDKFSVVKTQLKKEMINIIESR